jgi:hypothetical protein
VSVRRRLVALVLVIPLLLAAAVPVAAKGSLGTLTPAPKTINFGKVPVSVDSDLLSLWIYNSSKASVWLLDWGFEGRDADDFNYYAFGGNTECLYYFAASIPLAPGESCVWYLFFRAGEAGGHTATFGNLWNDGTRDFTPIANVKGSAFYET